MVDERIFESYIPDMKLFNRLDEGAQEMTKNTVLTKLVKSSASRYKFVDFSEFDKTKGDITRFKYYTLLSDSLNILFNAYPEVKEIEVLSGHFKYLHDNKKVFRDAFLNKNATGIMIYNTILLSIFEGTSYIISTMVEFVDKDNGIDIVIQKLSGTKSRLLMKNLENLYNNYGDMIKLLEESNIPGNRMLTESAISSLASKALSILTIGFKIIPAIRELIFLYYFARVKLSDAAQLQADFLQANAARLESMGEKKVAEKQRTIANRFNKIASILAVEHDKAENTASKEVDSENLGDEIEL